jgi:tetratricopeptide (TPR) repeat protein/energy-coupling factor transporter ATP-binding protein EcfA2
MDTQTLVNRETDKAFVKKLISDSNEGIILFISAPTGLGKSIFTRHMSEVIFENYISIRVQSSATKNEIKTDGFLVRELASSIDSTSKASDLIVGHNEFSAALSSDNTKNKYNVELLSSTRQTRFAGKIYERKTQSGEYSPDRIRDPSITSDIQELRDYIRFNLQHLNQESASVLITIENIQICDAPSLKYLSDLIYDCEKINLIFEYTVREDQGDAFHIDDIRQIFNLSANRIRTRPLKKLDEHCIQEVLKLWNVNSDVFSSILEAYKYTSGNIKKLEDINMFMSSEVDLPETLKSSNLKAFANSVYKSIFDSLDYQSSFIVVLLSSSTISLHRSLIKDVCSLALDTGLIIDADFAIHRLLERGGLIKVSQNDTLSLAHDSLEEAFKQHDRFLTIQLIVEKLLVDLFEEILSIKKFDFVSKYDCLTILVSQYSKGESSKLLTLLEYFKSSQMLDSAPTACEKFLSAVRDLVKQERLQFDDESFLSVLRVYYELDMFNLGYDVSEYYSGVNKAELLMVRAAFLNRLDRHKECIAICIALLNKAIFQISKDLEVKLLTLLMVSYRSINDYVQTKDIYQKLSLLDDSYKQLTSYALFLRNSEIVLPVGLSIENLEKSYEMYSSKGKKIEAGKVQLTLSMQFSRLGYLDKAKESAQIADSVLLSRNIDKCMVLNNKAVISAFEANFGEAKQYLLKAKNLATSYFNKVIITYNLLNVLSELGEDELLIHYIEYLESMLNLYHADKDLALDRSVYYNLSVIYQKNFNDFLLSETYFKKADNINIARTKYWEERLTGNVSDDFMLSQSYHYGFLSHWSINLD